MQKYNYETEKYDPYEVPEDWQVSTYEIDMDKFINCASCGKKVRFGSCYTSTLIHTEHGVAYAVDRDCYDEEMELLKKHRLGK